MSLLDRFSSDPKVKKQYEKEKVAKAKARATREKLEQEQNEKELALLKDLQKKAYIGFDSVYLGFDDKNKKIIWNDISKNKKSWKTLENGEDKMTRFDYKDLEAAENVNEYSTKSNSGAGAGLVGGLLLGPVGAIAGVASGRKSTSTVDKIGLYIKFKSRDDYIFVSTYVAGKTDFSKAIAIQNSIGSKLSEIYDDNKKRKTEPKATTKTLASQLNDLKELLDSGTITQTEFKQAKAKLLK